MRNIILINMLICLVASTAFGATGMKDLILTMSSGKVTLHCSIKRELLDDKANLRKRVADEYNRSLDQLKTHASDTCRLELKDRHSGRIIFDVYFDGHTMPTCRNLYEFVLHIDSSYSRKTFDYKVLIDRATLRKFNWNKRRFLEEHLKKARIILAGNLGYGSVTSSQNYDHLIQINFWSFEICPFGKTDAVSRGDIRNVSIVEEGKFRDLF